MGGFFSRQPPHRRGHFGLRHGAAEDIGGRRTMEDAHSTLGGAQDDSLVDLRDPCRGFFVVCDGHGGTDAAQFVRSRLLQSVLMNEKLSVDLKEALKSSFLQVDREFEELVDAGKLFESGTTVLAAAVVGSRLVLANAGDSRAVLSQGGRAQDLTTDHRPSSPTERERVEAAGGVVTPDGYLNGDLGVTRAIGDFHFPELKNARGEGPLTAEPEVSELRIEDDFEFLVMATDGAFEAMTSQKMVDIVRAELRRNNDPQKASQAVVDAAKATDVRDNITVVTVCFKPDPPPPRALSRWSTSQGRNSRCKVNKASRSYMHLLKAMEGA